MACGAYHSMVVLGDPSKNFKKVKGSLRDFSNITIGIISRKIREKARSEMVIGVF